MPKDTLKEGVANGGPSELGSSGITVRPRRKRGRDGLAIRPQRGDSMWKLLEDKLGGKDGFISACDSSTNPKAQQLIQLAADKAYSTWGTKKLAQKVGMTASEVVDLFRDRKWLETTIAIHEELPQVVRDAAQDARASITVCEDCKGSKKINDAPCWVCGGKGYKRKAGDKDKLSFIGEAAGITGKKGPMVQVNTQINNGGMAGISFEELMRKATLSRPKPVTIEASTLRKDEVIDAEEIQDGGN